jgi:murein DD-endopeptidase MepM/ murein hydrolase activator NlpD
MRLGALFAILVGVNIYVFFFRGGTSIHDLLKTSALSKKSVPLKNAPGAPAAKRASPKRSGPKDDSLVVQSSLKGHLGLSSALEAVSIDKAQVAELIVALRPQLDMRSLRPDHTFEVHLDPRTKRVRRLIYKVSPINSVVATRDPKGKLKVQRREVELDSKVERVGGRITSSLQSAMSRAGERHGLVARFVDLFSWDVNWYSDPREGDEFRIVVEKKYKDGRFYRYGNILAAEYRGKVGRFQAYYHKGKKGYFTPEGRAINREFLKMPLNFRRISSKFNMRRFHPVLHRTKGHYGVDYAAARGTPVWAVADGTVTKVGRSGGAGKMIRLQHSRGRTTVYMHLSRFAKKLKRGSRVKQRQVIGFVGSTGLATGPHLHYGIMVNGRHVDPLKYNAGKGALLPRQDRVRFLDELPKRMAILEAIEVKKRPAQARKPTASR